MVLKAASSLPSTTSSVKSLVVDRAMGSLKWRIMSTLPRKLQPCAAWSTGSVASMPWSAMIAPTVGAFLSGSMTAERSSVRTGASAEADGQSTVASACAW